MITWPAIVPTEAEDSPAASSEMANIQLDAAAQQRLQRPVGLLDRGDVGQAGLMESGSGHDQHRRVDHAGHAHGHRDIDDLESEEPAHLLRVARRRCGPGLAMSAGR